MTESKPLRMKTQLTLRESVALAIAGDETDWSLLHSSVVNTFGPAADRVLAVIGIGGEETWLSAGMQVALREVKLREAAEEARDELLFLVRSYFEDPARHRSELENYVAAKGNDLDD